MHVLLLFKIHLNYVSGIFETILAHIYILYGEKSHHIINIENLSIIIVLKP